MKNPEDEGDDKESKRSGLDRRQFGKVLAAGVGALTLPGVAEAQAQKTPPKKSAARKAADARFDYDVIIVGAGLSGLIAARELLQADKKMRVLVLEGNDCIGGRMVRQRVTAGDKSAYVDLGGQWVGETQYEMKALVAELGIKPFLSYEKGHSIKVYDGKENRDDGRTNWDGDVAPLLEGDCRAPHELPAGAEDCHPNPPNNCTADADERKVWGSPLDVAGTGSLLDLSRTVYADRPWDTPNAKTLDEQSFGDWLRDKEKKIPGYTAWLPRFQARIGGSGGFEPDKVSLLHMAWTQRVNPQSETPEKWLLCGGAGQIPQMLANALIQSSCVIKTGKKVTAIRQERTGGIDDGVRVEVAYLSENEKYRARAVIVAIPPPLRRWITFDFASAADVDKDKYERFAQGSVMGQMSKVHAVYPYAFWRGKCLSGSTIGSLVGRDSLEGNGYPKYCEFIADSSAPDSHLEHGSSPGILTSFISGTRSSDLYDRAEREAMDTIASKRLPATAENRDRLVKDAVQRYVIADFYQYFRDERIKTDVKDFVYINWFNTPVGGAFTSYPRPGIWTSCGDVGWRKPVGDIFWAGTETADRWPGFFDGAVSAGKTAALRVLAKWYWSKEQEGACPSARECDSKDMSCCSTHDAMGPRS